MSAALPLGPVMVDIEGSALSPADRKRLLHPACGGVILFARNHASPEQLAALTAELHALRDPPLLVAVDQEGGRVQRFREGFTRLPPMAAIGERYDEDPASATALAEAAGLVMAAELRRSGVDFSFAPVLDLRSDDSAVIGDRAFHADPRVVTVLAGAFIDGMAHAGMRATGKHFPGHGGVPGDSHLELPVDERGLEALRERDLLPFRALAGRLGGMMTAHLLFPQVDDALPTFSPFWIREILRKEIGFHGLVFSDDLSMAGAAAAGGPVERAVRALEAGCDMVLVCNDPEAAGQVLSAVGKEAPPAARKRLLAMRGGAGERLAVTDSGSLIETPGGLT